MVKKFVRAGRVAGTRGAELHELYIQNDYTAGSLARDSFNSSVILSTQKIDDDKLDVTDEHLTSMLKNKKK